MCVTGRITSSGGLNESGQSNPLSSCVAPEPRHSVSLMPLDAVCSYLSLTTIYVLFRLFAFEQAAAELFRAGRAERRQGNFQLLFLFRLEGTPFFWVILVADVSGPQTHQTLKVSQPSTAHRDKKRLTI